MTQIADILGSEAAAGSPNSIRQVGTQLGDISATASSIQSNLSGLNSARWTGTAADYYREKLDTAIPSELSKISDSFGLASGALNTYASSLDVVLNQASILAQQQDTAEANLASAQSTENEAAVNLSEARTAVWYAADPATKAQAEYRLSAAAGALTSAAAHRQSAEDTVTQLQNQAQALRDELQSYASACASQLQDASAVGIQNSPWSWFHRNVVDGVPGAIVGDVAGTIGKFAAKSWDVLESAGQLVFDPSPENLDRLAKAYSEWVDAVKPILLGLAAIALVVLLLVPGADIAVAAGAFLTYGSLISGALDASKLGDDSYLYVRGETSGDSLLNDAVDVGVDVVTYGHSPEENNFVSSLDKYDETGTSQARGWITRRCEALGPAEAVDFFKDRVIDRGVDVVKSLVPDAIREVHVLLGPVIVPDPSPMAGPFPSITQGPTARVRATAARRAAPVPATA